MDGNILKCLELLINLSADAVFFLHRMMYFISQGRCHLTALTTNSFDTQELFQSETDNLYFTLKNVKKKLWDFTQLKSDATPHHSSFRMPKIKPWW